MQDKDDKGHNMPLLHSAQKITQRTILTTFFLAAVLLMPAHGQTPVQLFGGGKTPGGIASPKLILIVMVDGLPNEQLTKNYDLFAPNGFRRLMDRGAWFTDAHQGQAITVTAVGHAAVVTGAYPYQHGIIGNEWRSRDGRHIYCAEDTAHRYLDDTPTTAHDGVSPKNLKVSTVGDELRYATNNASRVFAVSGKDRAAIMLAGKTGTAYMMSDKTGRFTSTSYYMNAHPQWWEKYYAANPQDAWFHKSWEPLLPDAAYARSLPDGQSWSTSYRKIMPKRFGMKYGFAEEKPGLQYYSTLLFGPYGDIATAQFAHELVDAEKLGRNPAGVPDILGVSFSSHDYINHNFGPESIQSQDHLIRLDRTLANFFEAIDRQVGRGNVLIVLTADHGFMNVPEYSLARGFEAGRIDSSDMRAAVNKAVEQKYGISNVSPQHMPGGITLDYAAIDAKNLNREELETFVARTLIEFPGIAHVFTRSQLERSSMPATRIGLLVTRAWHRQMAIDIAIVQKPFYYYMSKATGTPSACSHGTPYSYDTHVPLMFHGARWIKAGRYTQPAEVVDIAPTLSAILNIRPPSASEGKALSEMMQVKAPGATVKK